MSSNALPQFIQPYVNALNQHSRSIVAVLVIVVLYAAYCKIQRAKRRRQQNRRNAGAANVPVISRSQQLTPQQKYLELRPGPRPKVLLSSEVIFESVEGDDEMICREKSSKVLQILCRQCDVFLVIKEEEGKDNYGDDRIQKKMLNSLSKEGLIDAGFKSHRIIVCSTAMGKAHIARHLAPDLYMDVEAEPLTAVRQHIRDTVMIGDGDSKSVTNLPRVKNLESFFKSATSDGEGSRTESKSSVKVSTGGSTMASADLRRRKTAAQ
eukprot:CAMPEP_0114509860 /NCGR_PEP_ID=MMETSP0109-20121206/13454_1 /TAXON_ID=29199 /ORGANISM="Chlorarachnion reptans, Strain CCCM449" /LENGTH=265 /DNA_ID=CAMNT_0001689079 /DNA_START=171 /DNA_END=968 /DNA_ORIENTATION=-